MPSVLVWTSETPPPPAPPPHAGDVIYVLCRVCWYEKVAGEPCGLPCV
ncbi:hypothetical protein [Amycolatopsis sp. NPDC004378]